MLDVGQGDAILVQTPAGRAILIDGGHKSSEVLPQLQALGVSSLSMVIASHPHADHIGRLDEVMAAMPPKVYVDNGMTHTTGAYDDVMKTVEAQGIRYATAQAGWSRELDDGIVIEFLGPPLTPLSNTRSDLNSNSVITRITHGTQCFLFTGDAEEPTEELLLRQGIAPCNVLKVAHHGSAHSTSHRWLRAVDPDIALISCGEGNRYGHPAEETLSRLRSAGVSVYRTDTAGRIHLESDGSQVTVSTASSPPRSFAGGSTPPPAPTPQEQVAPVVETVVAASRAPTARPAADDGLININKASQSQLETLPGIGPSKASAIIEYRMKNGAFTDIEQLDDVPGIGPATMGKVRALVTL